MAFTDFYVGCTLFDGHDLGVVRDGALAVRQGRVIAAGARADVLGTADLPPSDARRDLPDEQDDGRTMGDERVIDLRGGFVMPGLVDTHTHLHFPIRGFGDWPIGLFEPADYTTLKAAYNAQVYLSYGITTVMDCGTRGNIAVALREAIAAGISVGPTIVASGMVLSPTAGLADTHPDFLHTDHPEGAVADSPDEWRRLIRGQAKEGVDNIKIGVSGSNLNPYSDGGACDMSQADIALVVEEAHRLGCTVAAHVSPPTGFKDALRAGVDTIHHGFAIDESCVDALLDSDAYFVPTAYKLPAMINGGRARGRAAHLLAEYEGQARHHLAMIARAVERGMADRIALGSDAGHLPDHGEAAPELEVFVAAGMSSAQALASATSVAAAAIGLADEVGTLTPGRRADFLVLDGDPIADVSLLRERSSIRAVYQAGRLTARHGVLVATPDVGVGSRLAPVYAGRAARAPRRMGPLTGRTRHSA